MGKRLLGQVSLLAQFTNAVAEAAKGTMLGGLAGLAGHGRMLDCNALSDHAR